MIGQSMAGICGRMAHLRHFLESFAHGVMQWLRKLVQLLLRLCLRLRSRREARSPSSTTFSHASSDVDTSPHTLTADTTTTTTHEADDVQTLMCRRCPHCKACCHHLRYCIGQGGRRHDPNSVDQPMYCATRVGKCRFEASPWLHRRHMLFGDWITTVNETHWAAILQRKLVRQQFLAAHPEPIRAHDDDDGTAPPRRRRPRRMTKFRLSETALLPGPLPYFHVLLGIHKHLCRVRAQEAEGKPQTERADRLLPGAAHKTISRAACGIAAQGRALWEFLCFCMHEDAEEEGVWQAWQDVTYYVQLVPFATSSDGSTPAGVAPGVRVYVPMQSYENYCLLREKRREDVLAEADESMWEEVESEDLDGTEGLGRLPILTRTWWEMMFCGTIDQLHLKAPWVITQSDYEKCTHRDLIDDILNSPDHLTDMCFLHVMAAVAIPHQLGGARLRKMIAPHPSA